MTPLLSVTNGQANEVPEQASGAVHRRRGSRRQRQREEARRTRRRRRLVDGGPDEGGLRLGRHKPRYIHVHRKNLGVMDGLELDGLIAGGAARFVTAGPFWVCCTGNALGVFEVVL